MGFGRKVGAFLGLVPGEQGDYLEGDEFDADYQAARPRRDYRDTEFDGPAYDRYAEPARPESPRPMPRSFGSEPAVQGALAIKPEPALRRDPEPVTSGNRPVTVKLTGFAEARVIGEKYRDGLSVILDMTDMSDSDARRLVDFSAGLAFSLHGSIDRVAPKVFMLLPPDADVAAAAHAAGFSAAPAYSH